MRLVSPSGYVRRTTPSHRWIAIGKFRARMFGLDDASRHHHLESVFDRPVEIVDLVLGDVVDESRGGIGGVRHEHHFDVLADGLADVRARRTREESDAPDAGV